MGSGVGADQPVVSPPKTTARLGPSRSVSRQVPGQDEERRRTTEVRMRLQSIHPNPGPRDKSDEGKRRRRERRKAARDRKREARVQLRRDEAAGRRKEELVVVTWNVQGMSLRGMWKRKAKSVAKFAGDAGWDAVLLSEVRADGEGVVWMGQDAGLVAIIHGARAAVMLRGELLKRWCEDGQKKKVSGRTVSVKVDGVVLVATYMPVSGSAVLEVEEARDVLAEHVRWAEREEILVVGGDVNAHVGSGSQRPGVCGQFGLRSSNAAGEEMLEWMSENGLSWKNLFFSHKRRGTWFSNLHRQWYELDGFMMREGQRHRHARKMRTVAESTLSDHKPKKLVVDVSKKKWRRAFEPKRVPRIRWEALKVEETEKRFAETAERKMRGMEAGREDSTRWSEIAENLVEAAKETCGVQPGSVENEWMRTKEAEDQRMRQAITRALERKNEAQERQRGGEDNDEEVEERKEELKEARKAWKRERKRWEKDWWEEKLVHCERAAGRGDQGAMYKALKQLGQRGIKKVTATTTITKEAFKDHFSKVSAERFENSPEEIEAAVEEAEDLRDDPRTAGWRTRLNTPPDREEVVKQMGLMRDGAPGEDGARLRYILSAGGKTEEEVVKLVQFMWVNGADTWEESLKRGLIIPLYKGKGDRNNANNYRGVCLLSMGRRSSPGLWQ